MPYRLPDPRFPRIVGIDAPWRVGAQVTAENAFVALLNCEPTAAWSELFLHEFEHGPCSMPGRRARIDGARILIDGAIGEPRELAKQLRQLVEHVSLLRQDRRIQQGSGLGPT